MNIIKRGYTLAEVLITLAVVGTIATITLPSLQTNAQRAQVVPALQKAMNTLTNANQKILLENDARTLKSVCAEDYSLCLMDALANVRVTDDYKLVLAQNNDASYDVELITSDNMLFSVRKRVTQFNDTEYYDVFIDINGIKGPNVQAKDVFYFEVDSITGLVAPKLANGGWNRSAVSNCANGKIPTRPVSCAAAIIENGWQIKYKY